MGFKMKGWKSPKGAKQTPLKTHGGPHYSDYPGVGGDEGLPFMNQGILHGPHSGTFMDGHHPTTKKFNEQLINANMRYHPQAMFKVWNPEKGEYEILSAREGRRRGMEGDTSVLTTRYTINKDGKQIPDPNWYSASNMYHESGGQYQTKKNIGHSPPEGEFRVFDKETNTFRQYKTRDSKNYEGTAKDGSDLGWTKVNPEIDMTDKIHATSKGDDYIWGYGGHTDARKMNLASTAQVDKDGKKIVSGTQALRDKDGNVRLTEDGKPALMEMSPSHYKNITSEVEDRKFSNRFRKRPKDENVLDYRYDQMQVRENPATGGKESGQFALQQSLKHEKGMMTGKRQGNIYDEPDATMLNFGENPVYFDPETNRYQTVDKDYQTGITQSERERIRADRDDVDPKKKRKVWKGTTQTWVDNISGNQSMDEKYKEETNIAGVKQKSVQKPEEGNIFQRLQQRKVDKTKKTKGGDYVRKIKGPDMKQKIVNGEIVWDRERDGGRLVDALKKLVRKRKDDQSQKEVDEAIRLDKKMVTEIPTKTDTSLPQPTTTTKQPDERVGTVSVDVDEMNRLNKPTPPQTPTQTSTTTGRTKETKTKETKTGRVKKQKQSRQKRERKPRTKTMTSSNKLRAKISDAFNRRGKKKKERKGLNVRKVDGGDLFGTIKRKLEERKARRAERKAKRKSGGGLFGKIKSLLSKKK
jgi:hypothetical protein